MKEIFENERYFLLPQLIFVLLGAILLFAYSKADLHILINQHNSPGADLFFKWITFLGDGLMYVVVLIILLTRKLKWIVAFAIAVAMSNLLLLLMKQGLFPEVYRPAKYFELFQNYKLHLVDGVKMHSRHSFPSGHTMTAFTIFLMLSAVNKSKVLKFVFFWVALLTGFSRIYLSQHFLVDVIAGSILGSLSVIFGIWVVGRFHKRWLEKTTIKLRRSHG